MSDKAVTCYHALPEPSEELHQELDELIESVADTLAPNDAHFGELNPQKRDDVMHHEHSSVDAPTISVELTAYLRALVKATHARLNKIPKQFQLRIDPESSAMLAAHALGTSETTSVGNILHHFAKDFAPDPEDSRNPGKQPRASMLIRSILQASDPAPRSVNPALLREFASYAFSNVDPELRAQVWTRGRPSLLESARQITADELSPEQEIAALNRLLFPGTPAIDTYHPTSATSLPPSKHPFNPTRWAIFGVFLVASIVHLVCR